MNLHALYQTLSTLIDNLGYFTFLCTYYLYRNRCKAVFFQRLCGLKMRMYILCFSQGYIKLLKPQSVYQKLSQPIGKLCA